MIANLIQKVRNGTAAARHRPVYLLIICLSTLFIAAYLYITTPAGKFSWKSSHPEDYDDHPTYHAGDSTELAPISNPTDYTLPHAFSSQFPSLALPSVFLSHPKLYRRLHSFLSRPIYSHNYAIEHDVNSAGCPRELSDRLVNPDQLEGEKDFWRDEVDTAKIIEKRSEMVRYLEKVLKENDGYLDETHREYEQTMNKVDAESMAGIPNTDIKDFTDIVAENPDYVLEERRKRSPIPGRKTRGIVTTGGNADTTLRLITLLRVLRREHHSTLPVEVWHFPNELTDNNQRKEIESLGGEIKQIKGMEKQEGAWKNFQIKGLAIVQSSFQELIYLDSDNIPLRDPEHLFRSTRYLAPNSGRAAFWPDLSKDHLDNAIWRLIGEPCTFDYWTFESGQIVIDKAGNDGLNAAALHLAAYMQEDLDFWFHMCGGDKDTFRWGFRALGIPFTTSPKWAMPLGSLNPLDNNRFCGHTVLQSDLDVDPATGEVPPLFVHSNLLKHITGLSLGNAFTHVKHMTNHDYSEPSLNYVHQWVYWSNSRGMCTDLELWNDGEGMSESARETQKVITEDVKDIPGQPFEGFEDYFIREGGRAGGWRKRRRSI